MSGSRQIAVSLLGLWLVLVFMQHSAAQPQVDVSSPWQRLGTNFHEQLSTRWGFRQQSPNGGFFFQFGGRRAVPPFAGLQPIAPANLGFAGRSGSVSWNFGISADQASSRSVVTQAPSIVLPHGGTGFISNTMQRPFVIGFVPVVGGRKTSPLQERLWRLKHERTLSKKDDGRNAENDRGSPAPATSRRPDDPPLILGAD